MKSILILTVLAATGMITTIAITAEKPTGETKVTSPLEFMLTSIDGKEVDLSKYKGKVVLFVNVASKCGYTKQYAGLQKLYETYEKDGLVIIGVPANEFGSQEPGTNDEIQKFCSSKFGVTFPLLSKVVVKGEGITPLYKFLTSKESNPKFSGDIGWNFEKFLVNRKGEVVGRYKSAVAPDAEEFVKAIKTELEAK